MRARCLILAMVLMVAAAVLSGCLSEQKIKIQNELSKLTDRFIEHLEAAEVAELEAMFADRLLLHTGVGMLDLLGEFMEELKIFWLEEWLPNPSEQDPERELWAGHLLPVSYTHLDVYKRQLPRRPGWRSSSRRFP